LHDTLIAPNFITMTIWWLQQADLGAWFALLGALFIAHAYADYAFQTDFMARAKNRHNPITFGDVPTDAPPGTLWMFVLSAHSAIHAGLVWILTGCGWLGLAEFILHWLIDWLRIRPSRVQTGLCRRDGVRLNRRLPVTWDGSLIWAH
jgi:hypothetical protein